MDSKLMNVYGTKNLTFDQYPDEAWTFLSGDPDAQSDSVKAMWATVPWLYQGVNIISQSAGELPIALYKGKRELTSSEDWNDPTGYLPDISKLLRKLSASLVLEGCAYLYREQAANVSAVKNLRFWNPLSVKLNGTQTKAQRRLIFNRSVDGSTTQYTDEQVIYVWPDDGYTEVGPPASSPAKAALAAAGVLANADRYVSAYWQRGAVKAMMLAVEGNPPQAEKDKLTDWWKSITGGVKKAFSVFAINAKAVTPVVIGEGLAGLQNTALTVEKREDVSTALGIPQSILFSTSAGGLGGAGVVTQDQVKFYEMTVIPLARLIIGALNSQQLERQGYHLVLNENEMAMYQEDESARASALNQMVTALDDPAKFLLAADIVGYEIDDITRAKIEAAALAKAGRAAEMAERLQPATPEPVAEAQPDPEDEPEAEKALSPAALADLKRWSRRAVKIGASAPFTSAAIPEEMQTAIRSRLDTAGDRPAILAVFDDYISEAETPAAPDNSAAIRELAEAIKAAAMVEHAE
jgi:phage portal protein BeeE